MRISHAGRWGVRTARTAGLLVAGINLAAAAPAGADDPARRPVRQPPPLVAETIEPAAAAGGGDGLGRLLAGATASAPFEHQVIEIVNQERRAAGKPPLKGNPLLTNAAEGHSERMAVGDFFEHCDLDTKKNFDQRIAEAGYAYDLAGENIAAGFLTPAEVMAGWMNSFFHKENILRPEFREVGVGYFEQLNDQPNVRRDAMFGDCTADSIDPNAYRRYWTQDFGRRPNIFPVIVEDEAWETSCAEVRLYVYGDGLSPQMRFSNDGVSWSDWLPFSPETTWTLPPGAGGTATVWAELGSSGGGAQHQATDTIEIAGDYPVVADLELSMDTVIGDESFVACDTLTAGDNFHVATGGTATFTARRVVLGDGFSVADGGTLRVTTR